MEFVSFEGYDRLYETVFFPRRTPGLPILTRTRPYLLTGKVQESFGAVTLAVQTVGWWMKRRARRKRCWRKKAKKALPGRGMY
jgi:hypothetical protein